jgi:hypothetical protein
MNSAILNVELSRSIFPFSFFLFPSFRGACATNNEKLRRKKEEFRPTLRIAAMNCSHFVNIAKGEA